jgi:predicted MFS family arabinose efflux permease
MPHSRGTRTTRPHCQTVLKPHHPGEFRQHRAADSDAILKIRMLIQEHMQARLPSRRDPGIETTGDLPQVRRLAARMITISWLAQNVTTGLAYGSYGILIIPFERKFGVDRALSSMGIPLIVLSLALVPSVLRWLLHYISIRQLMIVGALFCAAGYAVLSVAPSMTVVLLAYGGLVGPGVAIVGSMLPSLLVTNWVIAGRGRALGIIHMPIFTGVVPPLAAIFLRHHATGPLFIIMAAVMICLIPVLLLVVDKPEQRGLQALGGSAPGERTNRRTGMSYGALARQPVFWLVVLIPCLLAGGGTTVTTHIVPMVVGWGLDPMRAALLLTAIGVSGVIGSPLMGFIADKAGGFAALTLIAFCQALALAGLLLKPSFPFLIAIGVIWGLAASGLLASKDLTLSEYFGTESFTNSFGLSALFYPPFTVGTPVLAGFLFSATASYAAVLTALVVSYGLVIVLGVATVARKHRQESFGIAGR